MFGLRRRREPVWQYLTLDCGCWVEVIERRATLVGDTRFCQKHKEFETVIDREPAICR